MTVQDLPPTELKSPFPESSNDSQKSDRRAWVILLMTVVVLLGGVAAPNVIYAYRIRRIVEHGGYVVTRASYVGEDFSAKLGSRFHRFYQLCNTKVTLAAARASTLPAIQRWVNTRDLVWRPGSCEVY